MAWCHHLHRARAALWALYLWTDRLESASYFDFIRAARPGDALPREPDRHAGSGDNPTADLREYFHAIRPWFFTVLALYPIIAAITEIAMED
jgi:hypothetical protein